MDIAKLMHQAHLRYQRDQGVNKPDTRKRVIKFVEPTSETWIEHHRRFRPEGFYRLHCSHDRPLWVTCVTCKRNTKEAKSNFVLLLTGKLK